MLADPRQVRHDGDPERAQVGGVADPRQLEQLRRVERAAREDDLARPDRLRATALPLDLDADRAAALEVDPRHEGPGAHLQVRAAQDRVEVGARRADSAATPDVPIEWGEAFLPIPVAVLGQLVAGLLGRGEPGPEQRARRGTALQPERPAVP